MTRAVGVSTKELFKMMENGELLANEVLPKFAVELKKAARQGGALEAGMKTISAAQQRMATSFTMVMDEMSQAGAKEGIVDIFNTLSDIMVDLIPLFRGLGVVIKWTGRVFKNVIGPIFKILSPVVNMIVGLVRTVDDAVNVMFRLGESGKKAQAALSPLERTLQRIGDRIRKLFYPIKWLISHFDVMNDVLAKQGNFAVNAGNVLLGTEKGKNLEAQMNKRVAETLSGSKGSSVRGMVGNTTNNKSQVFNVNVDFKSTNADPAGVRREFENFFQTKLRTLAVPPA